MSLCSFFLDGQPEHTLSFISSVDRCSLAGGLNIPKQCNESELDQKLNLRMIIFSKKERWNVAYVAKVAMLAECAVYSTRKFSFSPPPTETGKTLAIRVTSRTKDTSTGHEFIKPTANLAEPRYRNGSTTLHRCKQSTGQYYSPTSRHGGHPNSILER